MNNAGFTHLSTIEDMRDKSARDLFDVNIFGLLNVIMREQQSGHIFNVSREVKNFGIKVTDVKPGFMRDEFF